ncbi:MAG: hypothetical protein RLZ32_220 [Gemmatimonadota bacterium]
MTAPPPPTPPADPASVGGSAAAGPQGTEQAGTAAALLYLYQHSAANRLRRQVARLREPRYLAAVVIGALYLWWALIRNVAMQDGGLLDSADTGRVLAAVGTLVLYLVAARWWLFGTDKGTLAFTPAEVQFLFPAPVSRRALIHAKLLRLQLVIFFNTVIFSILLRGGAGTGAGWRRGLALWMLFSALALHRLGVAIVRAGLLEQGAEGRRRSRGAVAVFSVATLSLATALLWHGSALRTAVTASPLDLPEVLTTALTHPLAAVPLWPVRALLAPVVATDLGSWLVALPGALAVLAAHYLWILRLDARFEEAAIEASQHRAAVLQQLRAGQLRLPRLGARKVARVPRLGVRGLPEMAIVWKNVAAAFRGGAFKVQLLFQVGSLALFAVLASRSGGRGDQVLIAVTIGWGAMLLFTGPLWMRFDLRQDLPRLAILKAWPLPGWRVVAAEIAGVTLLQSVVVCSLLVVPVVQGLLDPALAERVKATVPMLLAVVVLVVPVNALLFAIQNGVALLFPAWVRLGSNERGFEAMGQGILTAGASFLVLAVALVFPAGAAGITYLLAGALGAWRPVAAAVAAAVVLLLQLAPAVAALGTQFESTEVTDVPDAPLS